MTDPRPCAVRGASLIRINNIVDIIRSSPEVERLVFEDDTQAKEYVNDCRDAEEVVEVEVSEA